MKMVDYIFTFLLDTLSSLEPTGPNATSHTSNLSLTKPDSLIPKAAPKDLNKEILYESFIPIDAVVFLAETRHMSASALALFLKSTVLDMKERLLDDFGVFKKMGDYNLKEKVDRKKNRYPISAEDVIALRNKVFDDDKSRIAREIAEKKYRELEAQMSGQRGHVPDQSPNKSDLAQTSGQLYLFEDTQDTKSTQDTRSTQDTKYLEMMEMLRQTSREAKNVQMAINREKYEFYCHKYEISRETLSRVKINMSLGGSIFIPRFLVGVMRRLSKHDLVANVVTAITKPVEELEKNIRLKSFVDAKQEAINFLTSCLERRDGVYKYGIDQAFVERSNVLSLLLKDDPLMREKMEKIDRVQEKEIRGMIYYVKHSDKGQLGWIVRINSDIVDSYEKLLNNFSQENVERLLMHFR